MFKVINDEKENIAFAVEGAIKVEDYDVLTPSVEEKIQEYGYANLMLVAKDFKGEGLKAMEKDMKFGFGPYKKVKRFAVVTDEAWLKAAVHMMSPFTGSEEKVFDLDQQDQAWSWLSES